MSFTGYIKDLGISLGKMFYTDGIGITPQDSLLGEVKLLEFDVASGRVTGRADVSESRFSQYAWMSGELMLDGTAAGNEFELSAALPEISIKLWSAVFKSSAGALRLYNRKQDVSDKEVFLSGAFVELCGSLQIAGVLYEGTLSFVPFQSNDNGMMQLRIDFSSGDQQISCLEFLTGFCGSNVDVSSRMPRWAAYRDIVWLIGMSVCTDAQLIYQAAENGMLTGKETDWAFSTVEFALGIDGPEFAGGWFQFENLVMAITCSPSPGDNARLEEIRGSIRILDIPLTIQILNPFDYMEITAYEMENKPVSQLLSMLSLTTPSLLEKTVIRQLYLKVNFNIKGYYASVMLGQPGEDGLLTEKSSGKDQDTVIRLQDAGLIIDCMGEKVSVQAGVSLAVIKNGELSCQFRLEGSWKDSELRLKGSLVQLRVSLADLYDSFFSTQISTKFPDITIESLSIGVRITTQWAVESLEGKAAVSVKDKDVIGQEIKIAQAEILCDKDSLSIAGSFLLGKYFTIAAEYYRSGNEMKWRFLLLLDRLQLEVSYQKDKKSVVGRIQTDYSLGDMLDFLLRLLNPSESYERTGVWSFLNNISIKDTTVIYRTDTGNFSFTIKPSVKQSFIEIAALTVNMGDGGVKIQIQGEFMGTEYPEGRPLEFSPNDPPVVQGSGLSVSYLLFGTGIQAKDITGKDVNGDMKLLQKQFSRDTSIDDLPLQPEAGSMFAVETDIAGTVKIRLLYLEDRSYCGGYFELYGDNASVLKGLSAELTYSKIQGSLGVFSGKFTPSKAMRRIRFGAMTFSVGNIQADIYSNGDFFLNFGYPYERNFEQSFAFQYGIFGGSAGVYLQRASNAQTQNLLPPQSGYFTNVLGMGVGIKLRLEYGYQGGIFSAQASLVMQGCFEGVYARKQLGKDNGQDYYKLSADVLFTGSLQGRVDFGIVGAGVNVLIQASMFLTMSSEKAMEADIRFQVRAQAYVKVWFVKVRFQFSLDTKMHFSFASGDVPALGNRSCPRGLLSVGAEEKVQISCRMLPVITRYMGRPAAAVMLMIEPEEFDRMLDRLIQVLEVNHALETDELELFVNRRIAGDPEEIYQILEDNFVFVPDEPESSGKDADAVLMPLPDALTLVMERHYAGGIDVTERKLYDYEIMDEAYQKTVEEYYSDTTAIQTDSTQPGSVQSRLFTDFFELIFKVIRAQKEECMLRQVSFGRGNLTEAQYENIRGAVNRFALGGRRAPNKTGLAGVSGMARIAGSQIEFLTKKDIKTYRFCLLPGETMPDWLMFADGKQELAVSMDPDMLEQQLPSADFADDIFDRVPELAPAYQKVPGNVVYPAMEFAAQKYCYFTPEKSMEVGKTYSTEQEWGFAGMFSLVLTRVSEKLFLYRIQEHKNTKQFPEWIEMAKTGTITEMTCIFQAGEAYKELNTKECKVICLKNIASGADGSECCTELSETGEGLQMIWESIVHAGEYYLFFDGAEGMPESSQLQVWFVLRSESSKTYLGWHNAIYAKTDSLALTDTDGQVQQFIEQGTVHVKVHVSENNLSEEELRLRNLYSGLGAELTDVQGNVLTHETPSYFGEYDDNGGADYVIPFPYAKALTHDRLDIYKGISAQERYQIRLFWTDVLGNRLDAGKSVEIAPKYHDRLMRFDEFPSLTLLAYVSHRKIKLVWKSENDTVPDEKEKERIRYGYNQIMAEDVCVLLTAQWLDEDAVLDKSRFTGFLSAVLDGKKPDDLAYDTNVSIENTGLCLLPAEILLHITRKEELCEAYEGIAIQKSVTKLCLQGADDSGVEMLSGAEGACLLSGAQSPMAQFGENRYFRIPALPTVSGEYTGEDGEKLKLAGRDLDSILDQFLSDLEWLVGPETLLHFYQIPALRAGIPRINGIYKRAAGLLAHLVEPLCQYPEGSIDKEQLDALENDFFMQHLFKDRKKILFVQTETMPSAPTDSCRLRGVVGNADGFPVWLGMSGSRNTFSFAMNTEESCAMKDLTFDARYVYDVQKEMLLTPDSPDSSVYSVPFQSEDRIAPALENSLASPVIMSVYRSADAAELELGISLTAEDVLLLGFGTTESMQEMEGEQQVCEMEQYRLKSRDCMGDPTDANYLELLTLMENYLDAAECFTFTTKTVTALKFRLKDKGKGGYRKLGCSTKDDLLKVSVSLDSKAWHEMEWSEDGYVADTVELPEGTQFFLRMNRQGAEQESISLQAARQRNYVEETSYDASLKHILCTPQIII